VIVSNAGAAELTESRGNIRSARFPNLPSQGQCFHRLVKPADNKYGNIVLVTYTPPSMLNV